MNRWIVIIPMTFVSVLSNIDSLISKGMQYSALTYDTPLSINIVFIDSSRNQYTFWRQIQDPIWYSEYGDTIVFAWRGYEVDKPYYIACAVSTDEGMTWYTERRINEQTGVLDGGGVYVSATRQSGRPVITYIEWLSTIDYVDFGQAANISGNFNGDSSDWFGNRSGDLDAYTNNPVPLPNSSIVLNLLNTFDGFKAITYNAATGELGMPTTISPQFLTVGVDHLNNTVMAFGNEDYTLTAYPYDILTGQWLDPIEIRSPGVDTLTNGEILSNIFWFDGIILNDGTPLMLVDIMDGTEIDTVWASRSIWALRPDTAVRIWIAPNPDPVFHVAYSQLAIDRNSGIVYAFWMQLDEWRGDTTGYGSWDIWYSFSTNNGYSWSEPVNLTQTTGVDEAMFQVAKRVVNGRTWIGFLRPMSGIVADLYYEILAGYHIFPSNVFLGYAEGLGVKESGAQVYLPSPILLNNSLYFYANKPHTLVLDIFSVTGRRVKSLKYNAKLGKNQVSISLVELPKGIYFLVLSMESRTIKFRYLKIK